MNNLIQFTIAVALTVFGVIYITFSTQVKEAAFTNETLIANAAEAFLDKTVDSGAVTHKDYFTFITQLQSTGGTFEVDITVSRILPVPDETEPGSYTMEYVPSYGWSSDLGGVQKDYVQKDWSGQGAAPKGVQYLVKGDNVQLVVKQVDAMNYQRTILVKLNQGSMQGGNWSYSRAVRNTGSAIILNQGGS